MEAVKSPAGEAPVIGENKNLDAAVAEVQAKIDAIEDECQAKMMDKLRTATSRSDRQRVIAETSPGALFGTDYKLLLIQRQSLVPGYDPDDPHSELVSPHVEVCCPTSNYHVWDKDEESAVLMWNKAVEKLASLTPEEKDPANHVLGYSGCGLPIVKRPRRFVPE